LEKEFFSKLKGIDMNNSKYLVTINDNPPVIMCEKHAQLFEKITLVDNLPCTIYELDDEDNHKKCHACNLLLDIIDNQPRIILPN
jgi:hypothetical protein